MGEAKQTHTPGPWRVRLTPESYDQDAVVESLYGGRTNLIAPIDYQNHEGEVEANARLIATAPEMLEALERLSAAAINHNHMEVRGQVRACDICTEYDRAQAVILKAKGEL